MLIPLHTPQPWPGLARPLVIPLLEFNLLPSRTLHADHARQLLPAPPQALQDDPLAQQVLHRRWSEHLLRHLGPAAHPVLDWTEPALPLALGSPSLLARLARHLGIALIGRTVRRIVQRQDVLSARAALGEAGMAWALGDSRLLHEGLENVDEWRALGLQQAADVLGAGLLSQAWQDAPPALRQRADWKLLPDASRTREASGLEPASARALCLQCLSRIDSQWHSYFPAIR